MTRLKLPLVIAVFILLLWAGKARSVWLQPAEPDLIELVSWDAHPSIGVTMKYMYGRELVFAHPVLVSEPAPECAELRRYGQEIHILTQVDSTSVPWRYVVQAKATMWWNGDEWEMVE